MANIAIVNYCNLKCPYCFAEDMILEENKYMSLDEYSKIVDFILKSPGDGIGILGGEPTLHPNFLDIIKITNEKCESKQAIIFTNGIELEKFLPYLKDIRILINYNNPKYLTEIQKDKLQKTLDAIAKLNWFIPKQISLGCNIYPDCFNYDFLWDAVSKYSISLIRCSVAAPGGIYTKWKEKKDEYFNMMKPIYLEFCKNAIKHNCKLEMDCCHVPLCYFTEEELDIVNQACLVQKECEGFCPCALDFKIGGTATSCFGVYQPIEYSKFTNPKSLTYYLTARQNKPLTKLNNTGKCATCEQHTNGSCQGGCLAFANRPE